MNNRVSMVDDKIEKEIAMRVLCLHTPYSKKGRYAVIYDWQRWPERTLRHRGWENAERVFDRPATDQECQEAKGSMRFFGMVLPKLGRGGQGGCLVWY